MQKAFIGVIFIAKARLFTRIMHEWVHLWRNQETSQRLQHNFQGLQIKSLFPKLAHETQQSGVIYLHQTHFSSTPLNLIYCWCHIYQSSSRDYPPGKNHEKCNTGGLPCFFYLKLLLTPSCPGFHLFKHMENQREFHIWNGVLGHGVWHIFFFS